VGNVKWNVWVWGIWARLKRRWQWRAGEPVIILEEKERGI